MPGRDAASPSLRRWSRLLALGFAAQALAGYAVAFGYDSPLFAWHRERVGVALWGRAEFPAEAAAFRDFIMGVLGATMAGAAGAQVWVALGPFARGERWAWLCVLTGLVLWAPFDTALSLNHGVRVNAVFNAAPVLMMALPLIATWPAFWGRGRREPAP